MPWHVGFDLVLAKLIRIEGDLSLATNEGNVSRSISKGLAATHALTDVDLLSDNILATSIGIDSHSVHFTLMLLRWQAAESRNFCCVLQQLEEQERSDRN